MTFQAKLSCNQTKRKPYALTLAIFFVCLFAKYSTRKSSSISYIFMQFMFKLNMIIICVRVSVDCGVITDMRGKQSILVQFSHSVYCILSTPSTAVILPVTGLTYRRSHRGTGNKIDLNKLL